MSEEINLRFTGEVLHTIDPKNRVTIPAVWRDDSYSRIMLIRSDYENYPVIKCYTLDGLTRQLQQRRIMALEAGFSEDEIEDEIESISSACINADLNSQGKVVLPKKVFQHLNFPPEFEKEDLYLVGYGNFFRIWRTADFLAHSATKKASDSRIRSIFRVR